MDIRVADREAVERGLLGRLPLALISITDPDLPPASVPDQIMSRAVLRLSFDDAAPDDVPPTPGEARRLMSAEDADAVWRFVARWAPEVRRLVVHCEAGWSRSPAVAAAISFARGDDASRFFRDYKPNVYVFRRMLASVPPQLRQDGRRTKRRC